MLHRAAGDQDAAQRNDDRSDYEQKEPSRQPCGNPENPGSSPRLDPLPEQKRDAADQKGPNQGKSPEQPNVSLGGRRFSLQLGLEIEGQEEEDRQNVRCHPVDLHLAHSNTNAI